MQDEKVNVLLVSIDALKPEFVFEQKRLGIELTNISKYFLAGGTFAGGGVQSVFPTFTYPCHQSIITGVNPAVHKIYNNGIFDPMGEHMGAWHWFATEEVKTLWELAKEHGYLSASVAFPTSVCAKGDFIAPEFWWDGSGLDSRFINAMSKPQGLITEMEAAIGRYPGGLDLSESGDRQRFAAAMWILKEKLQPLLHEQPFFMSCYFASFDETAHQYGVYSKEAADVLQSIDEMLGQLIETAYEMTDGNLVVCVVSDHGTIDNKFNIYPNVKLYEAGLIELNEQGKMTDWQAWSQRAGGMSEVRLKDPGDQKAAGRLAKVMKAFENDPESGILEVLDREAAVRRGGFAEADYVLVAQKGYEVRDEATGEYCRSTLHQKAQHGYSEKFEEMRASFLITGRGIERGKDIGALNLIDIAPTLAAIMGFEMPQAEGENRL